VLPRSNHTIVRALPCPALQIDIRKQNAFHCSALFLRSLWAEHGLVFRPVLAWGWEDWDFWIRVHDKACTNICRPPRSACEVPTIYTACIQRG
jgi:hypothetical protein